MQLFITDFQLSWDKIIIDNSEIIQQMRKVLRMKIWDIFAIQKIINEKIVRFTAEIVDWDKNTISAKVKASEEKDTTKVRDSKKIFVAMPNKWPKAELIVQKLSEIGIQNIVFWPSERSVIKEKNPNKRNRLEKIAKEAAEQSRSRVMPKVEFSNNLSDSLKDFQTIVFDKHIGGTSEPPKFADNTKIAGIVWPEGGLTESDYENFWDSYSILGLGEGVLRMETAAIIGAWVIKNKA